MKETDHFHTFCHVGLKMLLVDNAKHLKKLHVLILVKTISNQPHVESLQKKKVFESTVIPNFFYYLKGTKYSKSLLIFRQFQVIFIIRSSRKCINLNINNS